MLLARRHGVGIALLLVLVPVVLSGGCSDPVVEGSPLGAEDASDDSEHADLTSGTDTVARDSSPSELGGDSVAEAAFDSPDSFASESLTDSSADSGETLDVDPSEGGTATDALDASDMSESLDAIDSEIASEAGYDSDLADTTGDAETAPDVGDAESGPPLVCGLTCKAGFKMCAGKCVTLDDPSYGCGTLTCTPCAIAHAVPACGGGSCAVKTCHEGWADCNGGATDGCESDLSLPSSCAACSTVCETGKYCLSSGCASGCVPPATACGSSCVDLLTSTTHCGGCSGSSCSASGLSTPTCAGGICGSKCATGMILCGSTCVDPSRDPSNCGGCGKACSGSDGSALRGCTAGSCAPCAPGLTDCPSGCVDLTHSLMNCGACGTGCDVPTQICDGSCKSPTLIAGLTSPEDIAVDATTLFWTDTGSGTVNSAPKTGGTVAKLATGQAKPLRIALDDGYVYWTNNLGAAVMRVSKSGGTPALVAAAKEPTDLGIDGSSVFWINSTDGTIVSAPRTGGATTTLATSKAPRGIAIVAGNVYYGELSTGVWRLPTSGGVPTLVAPSSTGFSLVAFGTDGSSICRSQVMLDGKLDAVPMDGSSTPPLYSYVAGDLPTVVRVVTGTCFALGADFRGYRICDKSLQLSTRGKGWGYLRFALDPEYVYFTKSDGSIERRNAHVP